MKHQLPALFAFLAGLSASSAAITVTIGESGSDIIMQTSGGTLDISALTFVQTTPAALPAGAGANAPGDPPAVNAGGSAGATNSADQYDGTITYTGDPFTAPFSEADSVNTSGDFFGVTDNGDAALVPNGFTSGGTISGSSLTFNNVGLSDIGWSVGDSGTWSWGSGTNADSITLTAVPEPGSYAAILGLMSLGYLLARRRRK